MRPTQKRRNIWDRQKVLAALRVFRKDFGRVPVANDFRVKGLPSLPTMRDMFGGWEQALSAAFPPSNCEERQVLMGGRLFLYEAKAPFEPSGESIRGALEYNEAAGAIKCHECGEFFRSLANHVKRVHSITAREYKMRHGLRIKTALVRDSVRIAVSDASRRNSAMCDPILAQVRMRQISALSNRKQQGKTLSNSRVEMHNGRGRCRMQTLEKIKRIAALLQKTPTIEELALNGVPYHDIQYHFGTARHAQILAGLIPNSKATGSETRASRLSEEFLIQSIRVFYYNHKRLPRSSDANRGLLPCSQNPFIYRFGSWLSALEIAFSPEEMANDPYWKHRPSRAQ